MDLHADTGESRPPSVGSTSIPTAGQIIARSIPAAAVAALGLPLFGLLLPAGVGEGWWALGALAIVVSAFAVLRLAQAPRPRFDKQISQERWSWSLTYVTKHQSVSSDPGVRTAAALSACSEIEMFIVHTGIVLGGVLAQVVRPELFWLTLVGAAAGGVLVTTFRLRRSWLYLRLVHSTSTSD